MPGGHRLERAAAMGEEAGTTRPARPAPVLPSVQPPPAGRRGACPDPPRSPRLLAGLTGPRHFGRLGIQGYGFTPMKLPADFRFTELIHAADERIPTDAVAFGTDAIFGVVERYGR